MKGANGSMLRPFGAAPAAPKAPPRETAVIVRCEEVVCAIAVRWISRLVLPEQVTPLGTGIAEIGGERHAAWDLGERLGLARQRSAWVLLRIPHEGGVVPLALRTGPCLLVQPMPEPVPLPELVFGARRGAIVSVFPVEAAHGDAVYGIELDVPRLWNAAELAASAQIARGGKVR